MSRRLVVGALVVIGLGVALVPVVLGRPDRSAATRVPSAATEVAVLERRDLVERSDLAGRLTYADERTLVSTRAGTLTWLAAESSIARRGERLYATNGEFTRLLYGGVPAWREFAYGMADGPDVRTLERNLVEMGYDPSEQIDVDRSFDWATSAAIRRWEDDLGEPEDGRLVLGDVFFSNGPVRISTHKSQLGASVGPGAPLADISSTQQIVVMDVPTDDRSLVSRGQPVRVALPGGSTARARITQVGTIAHAPSEQGGSSTIRVEAELRGQQTTGWDQAPVEVSVEVDRASDVLAAPVAALLALAEGGYAVEVVSGADTQLVAVRVGAFASGWVEVDGEGLDPGTQVVVAE